MDKYPAVLHSNKTKAIFVLIVLLTISFICNVVFMFTASKLFSKLQYSRIYPLGYVPGNKNKERNVHIKRESDTKLLFVGDSRSSMWDQRPLRSAFQIFNIAQGGQTSSQVLMQLSTQKVPDCDWVLIQVGINDLHPIGSLESLKSSILSQLENNFLEISEFFTMRGENIIFTTLFPPGSPPLHRQIFWDDDMDMLVKKINHRIVRLCEKKSLFLIDAYSLLSSPAGKLNPIYKDDDFFLHVNDKAYELLNKKLLSLIERNNDGR